MAYAILSIGVFVSVVTKLVLVIVSDKKAAIESMRHKIHPDNSKADK
jgi:hypothetical protein